MHMLPRDPPCKNINSPIFVIFLHHQFFFKKLVFEQKSSEVWCKNLPRVLNSDNRGLVEPVAFYVLYFAISNNKANFEQIVCKKQHWKELEIN